MNQIELVFLLKEINILIERKHAAMAFADLGIKMALSHADSMAKQFKGKKAQAELKKYRDIYRQKFNI